MPIPDPIPDLNPRDKQFEAYLKTFRPLAAGPLHTNYGRNTRRTFSLAGFALVAATVLLVTGLVIHSRHRQDRLTQTRQRLATNRPLSTTLPLTIRNANALLATSSSFKAAVDEMTFQPRPAPISKDKLSALAVLSKEKN